MFIKGGYVQFLLLLGLLPLVEGYRRHTRERYLAKSEILGREEAVALDRKHSPQANKSGASTPSDCFERDLFRQPELGHEPVAPTPMGQADEYDPEAAKNAKVDA